MAEQRIVEQVRKILVEEKSYPDPSNCNSADENHLIVYAQDDYKQNSELFDINTKCGLLAHSSKCADKAVQEKIWTDDVNEGKPEFVILNTQTNLAIVIECKKAAKTNNHVSNYLRDEGILVGNGNVISKYAVDGALHYAKFLSKKYDVIAIGVSGIPNSKELKISTYYWEKNKEVFYGTKNIEKKFKGNIKKTTLKYCYGPFINIKLDNIQSYVWYQNFINKELKKIEREFNEERATASALELNVMLDAAGVNATIRAEVISGLLLALRDDIFRKTYEDKEIASKVLQDVLRQAIERVIDDENIQGDFKKKVLKDEFKASFNQQDLLENNAEQLRLVIEKLHTTVYPCMNGEYSVDIIGKFYHEFLSYAKNSQNDGIKLTPSQITDLFCRLAKIKVTDVICDPCLGTGGFLISAMNKLYQLADEMDEKAINEFFKRRMKEGKINQEDIKKMKADNKALFGISNLTISDVKQYIRGNQLVGCEKDNIMYTLGCSNMILRGDGKSNILLGDCMKKKTEITNFNATVGLMNPPYSGTAYEPLELVEFLLDCVQEDSNVVVIVPTSCAHSNDNLELRNRILRKHTLLGVMSMSIDLFRGIADAITCIMVFKSGKKHNFSKNVYFGNWKKDGYYWHSTRGMIPDRNKTRYPKTPEEYMEDWINSFENDDKNDDEYGIWRKLTLVYPKIDENMSDDEKNFLKDGVCYDEWMWEYFKETDYNLITEEDFKKVVKDFMIFNLRQLEEL